MLPAADAGRPLTCLPEPGASEVVARGKVEHLLIVARTLGPEWGPAEMVERPTGEPWSVRWRRRT